MIISWYKKSLFIISRGIAYILIFMITFIRPLLGPGNICPFTIGCTQYALLQLQEQSLVPALKNIIQRLLQCHPFGKRN